MTRDVTVVSFIERYVDLIDESNYDRLMREAYNQLTNDQVKELREELLKIDIDVTYAVEKILTKVIYYSSLQYYGDKFAINQMTLQTFVRRYMNNMLGMSYEQLGEFIMTHPDILASVTYIDKSYYNKDFVICRK